MFPDKAAGKMTRLSEILIVTGLWASGVRAVNNGLGLTPQMGWNNWNSLLCDVSESLLLDTSKILIDTGLRDLGYKYVVLDDCWSDGRDETGHLRPDLVKFPNGMKSVANHLHDEGLLFGMYSSAGEFTCARYEGSLDHEKEDAESFASWEVDYLKYDNCYHMGRMGTPLISFNRYKAMWDALNATGRPIFYSLCNWGEDYSHTWGSSIANSWRMSGDIYDAFTRPDPLCSCTNVADPFCIAPGTHCSVLFILNRVATFVDRGHPGGWNDLDMLEVGQGGMTDEEYKAHFALWAAVKSPLLLGNDLRTMDAKTLSIINNPAIIALNQDPAGEPAYRVRRDENVPKDEDGVGETHVWSGHLAFGDQVVIFLNAANTDLLMKASLADIFVRDGPGGTASQIRQDWHVHDLWGNRMDDSDAESILNAKDDTARAAIFQKLDWYNSTATPYAEGLQKQDPRLLGTKIGTVSAGGILEALVPRHSAKVFRLRSTDAQASKRRVTFKDEL